MDVDSAPKSGASSMVPIAIGLAGVVLGAVGLFTALSKGSTATTEIADLKAKLDDAGNSTAQALQTAQGLNGKIMQQAQEVAEIRNTVQTNLSQMITAINADREAIKTIQANLEKATVKPPVSTPGGTGTGPTSTAVPGQGGVHIVKSGDLLGNLAKQYGVTVQAIEDANPGINPNNLRIGSSLKIPPARSAAANP